MLDAFDGCCVYDESARFDYGGYGILSFLIAGNAALELTNYSDETIARMCLDALPAELGPAKELLLDRRIRRWVATVSAIPGGVLSRQRKLNHHLEPMHAPGLVMVGDYLFDATLNGVMDSAEVASDIILADVVRRRRELRRVNFSKNALNEALVHIEDLMSVQSVSDILKSAWRLEPGAKVLHCGSGAGHLVGALRLRGFDAVGIECNREATVSTPAELTKHNLHGDFTHLPFEDGQFDAVIETGLYRTKQSDVKSTIAELYRVAKHGVLLGSVTTDLTIEIMERFNLLEDVEVLCSRWDWAEKLYTAGFVHALFDSSRLGEAWEKVSALGVGPDRWYSDSESLMYSVYERAPEFASSARKKSHTSYAGVSESDIVAVSKTHHIPADI
jgi:SAM-dependent methyltransferase